MIRCFKVIESDSGQQETQAFSGSGAVIDPSGYIVSNNHVVQGNMIYVLTKNHGIYKTELVGSHPLTDISILKIKPESDISYLTFADSDALRPGEEIASNGAPLGLSWTVTKGVISCPSRSYNELGDYDIPTQLVQIDSAVNPGNSGGPTINSKGQIIGINKSEVDGTVAQGISFCIASNIVNEVSKMIIQDSKVTTA